MRKNNKCDKKSNLSYTKYVVKTNRKINDCDYLITLKPTTTILNPLPGQFLMIDCGEETFLPRPYSVYGMSGNAIVLLVKPVGTGSGLLVCKPAGTTIKLFGPLGNGYDINAAAGKTVFLVSGGTGTASVNYLNEYLQKHGSVTKINFITGARNKSQLVRVQKSSGKCSFNYCTDDGSTGFHGVPTIVLSSALKKIVNPAGNAVIYTCGPSVMMKAVAKIANRYGIKCYASLEERMACGVGACRGCVVKVAGDKNVVVNKTVCHDGPVFDTQILGW
ncbi:MAG: dihydroorotate dehydrogenase electron transfer subunit [Elusimicrobiota bacterium]